MSIDKVNIASKLQEFSDIFSPRVVGELNGQQVKISKFLGEFIWHQHEKEDEMFLVIEGSFQMHLRDKIVELHQGDFIIIPKSTEHKPVALNEAKIMLFEPVGTAMTS